jgi:uncharacterized protein YlxW (UPF0749 family)
MDIETKRLIRLLELKDNDILALQQENKALKEQVKTLEEDIKTLQGALNDEINGNSCLVEQGSECNYCFQEVCICYE